jgi:hypothetical protein
VQGLNDKCHSLIFDSTLAYKRIELPQNIVQITAHGRPSFSVTLIVTAHRGEIIRGFLGETTTQNDLQEVCRRGFHYFALSPRFERFRPEVDPEALGDIENLR